MISKILSRMFLVVALVGLAGLPMKNALAADPENTLYLDLQYGRVVIELRPDLAPTHVARIKELTREGFYDGVKFHRVIEDFMAQTGDPTGTGRGGSGRKLRSEFTNTPHVRGTVSMARAQSPHSADSQFFIVLAETPHLNGKYTVWGQVIEGMEYVDLIRKGVGSSGMVPGEPDIIVKMQVAADAG
ncbi:MAG: peptidylprolyl isomerase [Sneathiella sp.]